MGRTSWVPDPSSPRSLAVTVTYVIFIPYLSSCFLSHLGFTLPLWGFSGTRTVLLVGYTSRLPGGGTAVLRKHPLVAVTALSAVSPVSLTRPLSEPLYLHRFVPCQPRGGSAFPRATSAAAGYITTPPGAPPPPIALGALPAGAGSPHRPPQHTHPRPAPPRPSRCLPAGPQQPGGAQQAPPAAPPPCRPSMLSGGGRGAGAGVGPG